MSPDTNPVFSGPASSCWVDKIAREDVISGRGSGSNDHDGNIRFRDIVKGRKTDYNASSTHRGDKSKIAQEIVNVTRENGGRFLRKATSKEREQLGIPEETDEAWLLLDDKAVLEKAKQALRQKERQQCDGDNVTAKKRERPRKRHASRTKHSRQKAVKFSPDPSQVPSQAQVPVEPRFDAPSGDLHINDDNTGLLDWRPSAPRYSEYGCANQSQESFVAHWEGARTSGVYRESAAWNDELLTGNIMSVSDDEEFFGQRFHPFSFQGNGRHTF